MNRLSIIFIFLITSSTLQADTRPNSYSATYKLEIKNIEIGTIERSLVYGSDSTYVFQSKIEPRGLGRLISSISRQRISKGTLHEASFVPIQYTQQGSSNKRTYQLLFDYTANEVAITQASTINKSRLTNKVLDELVYQAQLQSDLLNGKEKFEYLVQKKSKQKFYIFENRGTDVITTTLGKFKCKKMVRAKDNSKKSTILWVAKKLGYAPVKIELVSKGKKTIILLDKFSF